MRSPSLPAFGLVTIVTVVGLTVAACGETQTPGTTAASATGGSAATTSETPDSGEPAKTSAKGGSSPKSTTKGAGGNDRSSTSDPNEEGGSSNSDPNEEGGSSSAAGGTSAKTTAKAAGGTSSTKSATSKATGGTSSTKSTTTKATGGTSSTKSDTTKATGGTSSSSTTAGATGGTASSGTATTEKFSFFVISYAAIKVLSGSDNGFGGDLRYGQADGLTGADKICTEVAERGMAKNGKTWRAFLSTTKANAIDRIGEGPWYDRRGRVFAMTKADLLHTRPLGADTAIINDFPNENGATNHNPDGTQVDNHDFLTGSGIEGKLYKSTATCSDWTSSAKDTTKKPRVGHSWPRSDGFGMGFPGSSSGSTSDNMEGMSHWISALDEDGCGPGQYQPIAGQFDGPPGTGPDGTDGTVGSGGGYGGFYCFALTP